MQAWMAILLSWVWLQSCSICTRHKNPSPQKNIRSQLFIYAFFLPVWTCSSLPLFAFYYFMSPFCCDAEKKTNRTKPGTDTRRSPWTNGVAPKSVLHRNDASPHPPCQCVTMPCSGLVVFAGAEISSKRIMKVVSTLWHIKAFALIFWTSEDEAPPNYWRGIILWCASRHCPLLTSTPPGARDQQAYWGGGYVLYGVDHHLSCRSGQDHLTQHSFQNVFPVESTTTQKALQPQPALLSCPLPHAMCHIWHVTPKTSKRLKWRCIHIVQII